MNRIYTFALMSAVAKFLHSVVIALAIGSVFYTAYMSYQTVEASKENNRKLEAITSELKTQNTTLRDILKESTKSATPSASPTPKASPKV
jgi:threonine/homoserine/homoserine lactone efflux protein